MLPLSLSSPLVSLLLGLAFGFTLERSGFGDARRLAAQFYFRESRVVKVMFTAIVTCMLLLLWATALGWLDPARLFVNPTYLASGILGGFVLGLGFIVGGYCPGTSLVSAATLKKDGIVFVLGVGVGSWAFSATAPDFRLWYDRAGALGRVTLPEFLGLSAGVVAVLVVLMALGMFAFFDFLQRRVTGRPAGLAAGARLGLAAALLLAVALPVVGMPTAADRARRMAPELDAALQAREPHLDAIEVLGLMHNHVQGRLGRFRLLLVDVRDESDHNLFHLVDARRVDLDAVAGAEGAALADPAWETAIKVVMSNDEAEAEAAWRLLRAHGVRHAYVLSGGINGWLATFAPEGTPRPDAGPGALRWAFDAALGDRYPASRPAYPAFARLKAAREAAAAAPEDLWKVRPVVKAPTPSGGCG